MSVEKLWSIPVEPTVDDLVNEAARRTHRSKASFIRWATLKMLQSMGMIDGELRPIPKGQWPQQPERKASRKDTTQNAENPHG
jgi:hypothetical protein